MEAKNSMEPVFAWSVPHTLKKRNQTIAKVKAKYWLKTHKFRIKVPKSMKQAIEFNRENVNKLWWDAVCKDMKSVCPAFEPWEKPEGDIPPGYQEIKCHLIFDIKMGENFLQKDRFFVGGQMTETPTTMTYTSVVLRYLVRIMLNIEALNGFNIFS